MALDCISTPWEGLDFVPCFRETVINGALPVIALIYVTVTIVITITQYQRTSRYSPLNTKTNALPFYGATNPTPALTNNSGSISVKTACSTLNTGSLRWSVYDLSRCGVSLFQLVSFVYLLNQSFQGHYETDKKVEGQEPDVIMTYGIHAIYYGILFSISLAVLVLSGSSKSLADSLCNQAHNLFGFDTLVGLINLRSYYLVHDVELESTGYTFALISFSLNLGLFCLLIHEERQAPDEIVYADNGRVLSGEEWASTYSKYMFSWVNTMMKQGYQATLNEQDLMEMVDDNRAKNILRQFRQHHRLSMAWALLKTFKAPLAHQWVFCMVWSIMMFGPPYFLNKIIRYIEHTGDGSSDQSVTSAFLSVFGLFLSSVVMSLAYQRALYIGRCLGTRIQSIVIGEVYEKTLRRRDETGKSSEDGPKKIQGNVDNLLSVDSRKMGELTAYVFYIYCFPLQISVCIWSLYRLLGTASLYGMLVMLILQPVTYILSSRFQSLHHVVMACTDKRIKLTKELLSAIRIVKFFAWEDQFRNRISEARLVELKAIRSRLYMYMWMGNAWFMIPILIMVTVFYIYTKTFVLTASTAFTALALFNTFKTTLDELPVITSFILQANVSLTRIEDYLKEEEVVLPANGIATDRIGFINKASFSWDKSTVAENSIPTLRNLDLCFPSQKLSLVCGPTGSGKTTLLASLLGETYCHQGAAVLPRLRASASNTLGGAVSGIAYVAQTAWLQNCSIKNNILFGLPYDEQRYQDVLYMTALTRDLEILECGDSTEVGEKGITLSGGQKQRVAIARAVYSQASTVLLDDCLSAVDAHTAKHLYEYCLNGPLMKSRTVILVTHHVSLCIKAAAYVVALLDGEVAAQGDPATVIQSGALGDELVHTDSDDDSEEDEQTSLPLVPRVAATAQLDGAGRLTLEEKKAEGGVDKQVYVTYFFASGGIVFWLSVLVLFCCAQATVVGQDYWIKIWSAAYSTRKDILSTFSLFSLAQLDSLHFMNSSGISNDEPLDQPVDVTYYLGIYFAIGILALIVTTLRQVLLFEGSLTASKRIHAQLLESILRAKVRFFDTTPLGRIVNRFSSDLETIDQSVAPSLSLLLYSIIATIYVVFLVSIITPSFLIPAIFIGLLYWAIGVYYLNTSRDLKRLNSVSRSPIYVQLNETVNGVATIRAFGAQERFVIDNLEKIDANNRPFLWMWATNRWLHCRVDFLGAVVSFCAGAVLIMARSWVDPGLAGLSLSYALTFNHHVLWVVRMYAINEMNMNAIERAHEYLELEPESANTIVTVSPPHSWPEAGKIEVKDLVIQYGPDTPAVLRGVSFKTRPREKIGIVGRTGSGKSTLALSLFRFMEPTEGQIVIDGVDIHSIALKDLRSRLTIIPQDPVLFSGTLRSNLDPFGEHDDADLWASLKRAHLIGKERETDTPVTLDAPVTENGSNWSQGQRQLIALARALVKRSSLIILDEATSSVDFDTDHKIQETIRTEFVNASLLCIAHRIRTVADYDRILVLDQGKVVEYDTPYALMTKPDGVFHQMCERSGEYTELLAIAQQKHISITTTTNTP
ncbi:hypothetical protein PHYBLDRAFT_185838 [Phycomyces blakesleeanus NRRL 1555(-)]|uniref:ATP-binding cassette transporter n=1 Tax=Phycomyces blakesleeanus (strain ATCC 8743b / DSM 1359 / FGSC 10004 / NBRC 33097 / NRRL 1555) TaxID=763407 RepID=A0A163E598_PHYB8|nr:hypothetical protein PHYBLDRAFT_185838 [Phycomyces blakesleeanus NRRL 1555(-)]OAD76740.1 hypothetical protein PHYBLDRAFT_185838 [Phycomyces blakesleeanus NRRL 1555(-)]|eukprot:XP_018294780.1 hypothetical protein PHYBLDRAFT_185838 [Phycomyces blakesleeanus NRRL 1555(-)]